MKTLFAALLLTACCAAQDGIDCDDLGAAVNKGKSLCTTTFGKHTTYTEVSITDSGSYVHVITHDAYFKAFADDIAEMDREIALLEAQAAEREYQRAHTDTSTPESKKNQDKHECPTCDKIPDQIK